MSIDAQSRGFIRYAFELDDPYLADLVRRVNEGENLVESFDFSQSPTGMVDSQVATIEESL